MGSSINFVCAGCGETFVAGRPWQQRCKSCAAKYLNHKRTLRYQNDPVFHAKEKKRLAKCKSVKWATDPEYRKKQNERRVKWLKKERDANPDKFKRYAAEWYRRNADSQKERSRINKLTHDPFYGFGNTVRDFKKGHISGSEFARQIKQRLDEANRRISITSEGQRDGRSDSEDITRGSLSDPSTCSGTQRDTKSQSTDVQDSDGSNQSFTITTKKEN